MTAPTTSFAEFLGRADPVLAPAGPLLVASDTSPGSDAAFPMARVLAQHTGAEVQVISALRPNAMPTYAYDAVPYPVAPLPELLDGREALLRAQMARLAPAAPWKVTVRGGDPVREILEQAKATEARLIVVGRGKHGLLERMLGGESVLRLLQLGETPVFAVERTLEWLPRRVVIATDFSVFSIYAAQVALDLIAPDATIQFVHVAPMLGDSGPVLREFAAEYRQQAQTSFEQLMHRLGRPGLTLESTLLEGNASTRLADHCAGWGADLVVTATHGYGFVRRMVLGSVTAELVRHAPCSVLCVPGSARTHAAARAQATALHDVTHTFTPAELDGALAAFSRRNLGRFCTVEVTPEHGGARSLGHHLPLVGCTYDRHTESVTLMFGASSLEGEHLAHTVDACETVQLITDRDDRDQVIRIVHEDGETLMLLE